MKILTASQIRGIDRLSTEKYGVPSLILMENAGMRVVEAIEGRFEDIEELTIAILCGKGNNGGDGFVVARQLLQKGCVPFIFLLGSEDEVKADARVNLNILKAIGSPPTVIVSEEDWSVEKLELLDADVIVDAMLGTGLTKPVSGVYRAVIESVCEDFPRATIISIDVPSGLYADRSEIAGAAVQADVTVTFTALKRCLVFPPSHQCAGDVIVADIGNPAELLEDVQYRHNLITAELLSAAHHRRSEESNKGDYGKVLVVGGSRGKSGAAAMVGQAAMRAGAGLVTVATTASALPMVAAAMPELMTEGLLETDEGSIARQSITKLLEGKTLLAIGPGLTTHAETREFVRDLVSRASAPFGIPVVIDADGLNAFVGADQDLSIEENRQVVITPHPGEMSRLIGKDIAFVTANRLSVAADFAADRNVHVVLKGFRTIVATPDGSLFINPTGNPGMATAGAGDVLTGLIAGILAQERLGSFVERLCLAVYLHGLSGDLAAEELGEESLVATDILRFLGGAWKRLRES